MANPLKGVKNVKNVSWGTVGSVAVGMALFGLVIYGVRRLPSGNVVTDTVKKGADIATSG